MFQIFIAQLRYQDYRIHRQSLWIYIQMFLKSHKLFIALECIVNISDIEKWHNYFKIVSHCYVVKKIR